MFSPRRYAKIGAAATGRTNGGHMKTLLVLIALLLLPVAAIGSTAGNPDQRPSILLGGGYDWGKTQTYLTVALADNIEAGSTDLGYRRLFGTITVPASRSLSLILNVSNVAQGEPDATIAGEFYTRTFATGANLAIRIYLP